MPNFSRASQEASHSWPRRSVKGRFVNNQPRKFDDLARAEEELFLEENHYPEDDYDSWSDDDDYIRACGEQP